MNENLSNGNFWEDQEGIPDLRDMDPEDREKWLEFYSAIEGMNEDTPGGRMPIESRDFLGSIWDDVLAFMDKEDRKFSDGNIMLNFPRFKLFRDAFLFAKDLEMAGVASNVKCLYRERSKHPSDIIFHTDRLDFKGELKDRFADIVGGSCVLGATGKLSGGLDITIRFSDIWIEVSA